MFTEILKFIPKIDSSGLASMERSLSSRFKKVATGFGKGLLTVLKGGGIAGAAIGLIDKFLNPLKETQDAIERSLSQADDVVTNAEQFNTTPGKLFKLQKFAQATGLDADGLNQLLLKFQTAVVDARKDPTKDTAVRQFTNDTDTAESFFRFMQNLNKLDRKDQVAAQQDVFGEKLILKMAEFLRLDFGAVQQKIGLKDAKTYDPKLQKLAGLNDQNDINKTKLSVKDLGDKARVINGTMVQDINNAAQVEQQREQQRIANFHSIASLSDSTTKIMGLVERAVFMMSENLPKVTGFIEKINTKLDLIGQKGFFRGVFGSYYDKDK